MEHYTSMVEDIASQGYGSPVVIPDGQIHRFTHPDDKPNSNNCWVVSYGTAGAYGSWKLGTSFTWYDGKAENNAALLEEIREYQRHRKADQELIWADVAIDAREFFYSASAIIDHIYPINKNMAPFSAHQAGNALMAPMYYRDKLVNVQKIYPDGKKRYMKGARKKGCYLPLGEPTDHIHVCEGYATGCTLREYFPTICVAFDAGGLKPAALAMREKYPDVQITIACDNDWETEERTGVNPGLEKGRAAAAAVGGNIIFPVFDPGQIGMSDYNDFFNAGGEL